MSSRLVDALVLNHEDMRVKVDGFGSHHVSLEFCRGEKLSPFLLLEMTALNARGLCILDGRSLRALLVSF